jgi:cell division protein FtsX
VEEVDYDLLWIERLTAVIDMVRALGFFIGGALIVASIFTIFNVIKLTVYGRRGSTS